MKKMLYIAVVFFLISASIVTFLIWRMQDQTIRRHIPDCRASFVIHNNGYQTPLILNVRVNDDAGLVFYEGPVYKDNKLIGVLNRQVDFTITRFKRVASNRGTVLYTGVKIERFPKDTLPQEEAVRILPKFFVIDKSSSYFDIVNMRSGAVFIKDNIPMFFCRHNE